MSSRWLGHAIGTGAPTFVQSSFTQYAGALLQAYSANMQSGMSQPQALAAAYGTANTYAAANRDNWMTSALAPGIHAANDRYNVGGTKIDSSMEDIKSKTIPTIADSLNRSNLY